MVAEPVYYGPEAPVPIFQHEKEFVLALDLYMQVDPKNVLEIGTYHGGTLYHWLRNASPDTVVVSVDSYTAGIDNRDLYNEWVPEDVELVVIEGDSRDQATIQEVGKHKPFDWIFIDAGHYYEEVKSDWDNYRPMAREFGSAILLHDILSSDAHPEIEVDRLWREIQEQGYVTREIVYDRECNWGGIGVVLFPHPDPKQR